MHLTQRLGFFPGFFSKLDRSYYSFEPGSSLGLYYAHPYVSYAMRPGYKSATLRINREGFRGPELRKGEVFRIVCMGGSTTYGIGLPDSDTYPAILQRELSGADPSVEVVNAGLVSATTAETLALFLHRIVPLKPDALVFYEGYNDLVPRIFSDFQSDYRHFRRTPRERLAWFEHLKLYRLLDWKILEQGWVRPLNSGLIQHIWRFENLPATDAGRIDNFQSTDSASYRRNLDSLIRLARAYGIQVVVVTFGFRDELEDWNTRMPGSLWAPGIEEHNGVVRDLAEEHNLPLVDFYPEALTLPQTAFDDSIHLSVEGNLALARAVAKVLRKP